MKTQSDKSSFLPPLITGVAIVLFSTAGIARMMGWGPNSTGDSGDMLAPGQTASVPASGEARARPRCAECGVVVSMREIEGHDEAGKRYEFIVRMADGSNRVIADANPASWRTGEGVIVLGGVKPPSR
jgi:hypothetical protein